MPESDTKILTLYRVEIGEHVVFVKKGEKPRIRVKMGRANA